jgi:hypothetical protein
MNTTEPLTSPPPESATRPWSDAPRPAPLAPTEPTFGEIVEDVLPVIGVVDVAGPPVILVAGPWLLLGLMLTGPFALLVTFVVVGLVAAALLVIIAAILAAPYVLVRALHRRYRASQAISVPATHVASFRSRHVAA